MAMIGGALRNSAPTSTVFWRPPRRWLTSCRLFVGGLSPEMDETTLKNAFRTFGQLTEVTVVSDEDGKHRGFGFVSYKSNEQAEAAFRGLDGKELGGKRIRLNYATRATRRKDESR